MSGDYKRLFRSREERMLFGVCGGIGEYFNVDPTLIRLVFVALIFLGAGGGLLLYLVMAIIVPEKPLGQEAATANASVPASVQTELDPMSIDDSLAGESPGA